MSFPTDPRNPSHSPPPDTPAAPGGRGLFIYYRVAQNDTAAALQAAQAVQCELRARHPGLKAELWRRPETKDGMHTWMEIYTHADGIDAALEQRIEAAAEAVSPWIQGPRHVEVFVPCVS